MNNNIRAHMSLKKRNSYVKWLNVLVRKVQILWATGSCFEPWLMKELSSSSPAAIKKSC